ncbi:MAG: hypothetical protein KC619_15750 [Myxococcales bacterium]|nr:hypothetical protein [Myxococcales bacterium]
MTERVSRLLLRAALTLGVAAAVVGGVALCADAWLRFEGSWTGGYYADPGADAHAWFVWLAGMARAASFVATGALAALAVWQPRPIRPRLRWLWLALPLAIATLALALYAPELWPVANPRGAHPVCYGDWGHPCPSYPLVPEAWVRYQLAWSVGVFTLLPSLLVVFLATVVGLVVRGAARGVRLVRDQRGSRRSVEPFASTTSNTSTVSSVASRSR